MIPCPADRVRGRTVTPAGLVAVLVALLLLSADMAAQRRRTGRGPINPARTAAPRSASRAPMRSAGVQRPCCAVQRRSGRTASPTLRARSGAAPATGILAGNSWPREPSPFMTPAASSALATGSGFAAGSACTPASLATAADVEFVDAVASGACLAGLWDYGADVRLVFDGARVDLVLDAVSADAGNIPSNVARLEALLLYLQIGFYHEWYEADLTYDQGLKDRAATAVANTALPADFMLETPGVTALRAQWIVTIDSVNATHLAVDVLRQMLERWRADPTLALSWSERSTAFQCYSTLARQVGNQHLAHGSASPWYALVDSALLDAIEADALDTTWTADTRPIVENALYALGACSVLQPVTAARAHAIVTTALSSHGHLSAPWLRAVLEIDGRWGGLLSGGGTLDADAVRDDVRAQVLPDRFERNGGRLVFETAVPEATVDALVDAVAEVRSQFFRVTGALEPVLGDDNDVFTLVIFGSRADYEDYQPFLHGLGTANGGIYIEATGTLYTYERESWESLYTLEELLRHEIVHALDARHMVTGGFYGNGTLYEGGRIDSYTEGLAEYLVGATRRHGVLPRHVLLDRIATDTERMSVAEVLAAGYGAGFRFYRYAGSFLAFLGEARPALQSQLFATIRADDAAALDALYAQMSADAALQADWSTWLADTLAARNSRLLAEDVATTRTPAILPADNAEDLRSVLRAAVSSGPGRFAASTERFRWSDRVRLPVPGLDATGVRALLGPAMDGMLQALEPLAGNFTSTTGWFGEVGLDAGGADVDIVIEGPYHATSADATPPATPAALRATPGVGAVALSWEAGDEADLAGWDVLRSELPGGPFANVGQVTLGSAAFLDTDPRSGSSGAAGPVYYAVAARDASGNSSAASAMAPADVTPGVLVVNGSFAPGRFMEVDAYTDALDALGAGWDVWDPFTDGEPDAATLAGHDLVVWAAEYAYAGDPLQFSAARQTLLEGFLQGGGALMLSGAYTSAMLGSSPLFSQHLGGVSHVNTGVDLPGLLPVAGSALGQDLTATLASTVYTSEVDVGLAGNSALHYDPTSGSDTLSGSGTAVVTAQGVLQGSRAVFLAFPFDGLATPDRAGVLGRVVDWTRPGGASLAVHPGSAGTLNAFVLTGADPGATVYVVGGRNAGVTPIACSPNDVMIDPAGLFLLAVLTADEAGTAVAYVPVPSALVGQSYRFQVGLAPACALSNTVDVTF